VVTRLDGLSAEIAKGLVDRAMQGETSLTMSSGVAYFDSQATRHPEEWQYKIDEEIKTASELSREAGFKTVLNVQANSLRGGMFMPPLQYFHDPAKQGIAVAAQGATGAAAFSFPPVPEVDFTFQATDGNLQNTGNGIALTLGSSSDNSRARLTVTNAAGAPVWDDRFATDTPARYRWHTSPRAGVDALWAWGWYGGVFDSYRFVPGAVGDPLYSPRPFSHPR
jgi:hypothetical protein